MVQSAARSRSALARLAMAWVLALPVVLGMSVGCAGRQKLSSELPTERARREGPSSTDGDVVGRWIAGELIGPGGTPERAREGRRRLAELGEKAEKSLFGALARGIDDGAHGDLAKSGDAYLDALVAARGSADPLAPVVAWYATNHLLAADSALPALWERAKPWVEAAIEDPGRLGWRARGELVEWWSRHAFLEAQEGLSQKLAEKLGCVRDVRLAGPFGRVVSADRWTRFGAEDPGPWPLRWAPDPARNVIPRTLRVEQTACLARVDEPVNPGVFYAEVYLDLASDQELVFAVQGALAIWIDDEVVLDRDPRKWGVWQRFGVGLHLAAGRHRVLARLTEPETSVRVLRADGAPATVKTSADPLPSYGSGPPGRGRDPNVLDGFVDGRLGARRDVVDAYLAAHLAAMEGQNDVASVLVEPLVTEHERAAPLALVQAAAYAERDPIFPDGESRDLGRMLRSRALEKDPGLIFARLWLAVDKADKGLPETARALKQLADEHGDVPEVWRVLVTIYGRLGWRVERAAAVRAMLERFPQDRGAIEQAIGVFEEQGRLSEADALVERLVRQYPDSEIRLDRAIARRDYDAAIAELERLAKRRPDRKDITDRIAALLTASAKKNDPLGAIERGLKKRPRDGSLRLALADLKFAAGDAGALRSALAEALAKGYSPAELRAAIDLVEGATSLEPYRIDARPIMKEYEADPEPMSGTAARVLDYSTLWIHRDGSSRMLEHEVIRVQSQDGIDKLAEQPIPDGALVLKMRVLKKDGTVLEPERVEGKPTVTMPHLEVGDYIETEYITTQEGDGEGGKRYLSPHWFFREKDIAYWRSEFVVVSPKDRALTVETTGTVPAPAVREEGPLTIRRWRVDRSPAAPTEPESVPLTEFLPSVLVGWGLTEDGQLRRMADAAVDDTPRDPRLVRMASRIIGDASPADTHERARRLYRWVLASVEDGRETDGRRVVTGRSGSRASAFLYLARCLGLPVEVIVTRDRRERPDLGPLSATLAWNRVALRLAEAPRPAVFSVGERHAPFGYLPAELRGQPMIRLVPGFPREETPRDGAVDGIAFSGVGELRSDGSAVIELDQSFLGALAIGVRSSIEQIPDEQLRSVVEARLLQRTFPGARLQSLSVVDKDDLDKPLVFRMKIELSDLARRRGDALAIRPPVPVKLGPSATLEARQTPLLMAEALHSEVRVTLRLPAGVKVSVQQKELRDGERFVRVADSTDGTSVTLSRIVDVPAGRVQPEQYARFREFSLAADELLGREILVIR